MSETGRASESVCVLLVENSAAFTRRMRAELGALGWQVRSVPTLREAADAVHDPALDVVLLDLDLDDSSGLPTLRSLLADAPKVPVVVLSLTDDPRVAYEAVHAGAEDYVVKGTDTRHLVRAVMYAIHRRLRADEEQLARAEYFAAVSHELRTPLFAIAANADVIGDSAAELDAAVRARIAADVRRAANHLLGVVDEVVDVARYAFGVFDLSIGRVGVRAIVQDVVDEMRPVASRARLRLDASVPELMCEADPARLRQVVANLVSNALKYTPSGGTVEVVGRGDGQWVVLEVRDTGVGITAQALPRIWQPFYRVPDNAVQHGQPSSGLGLALTKVLVEAQGGRITVASTPGAGSTFRVRFPQPAAP